MPSQNRVGLAWLAAAALSLPAQAQPLPSTVPLDAWGPSGPVRAVARSGDTLYIGGTFNYVGPLTGGFAVFDGTGALTASAPELPGPVTDATPLPDGGWIVLHSGRTLARLDSAGRVVPTWNATVDGEISAVRLSTDGQTLFLGGTFGRVNGIMRRGLAAIDVATATVTPWAPPVGGSLTGILAFGTRLVLTGYLCDNMQCSGIAAVEGDTGARVPWPAFALNVLIINAMAIKDDELYISGALVFPQLLHASGARIDLQTGQALPWNPDSRLAKLEVDRGRLFGRMIGSAVELDPTSGAVLGVLGAATDAMAVRDGRVYLANSGALRVLDVNTGTEVWRAATDGFVAGSVPRGNSVAVIGGFRSAGGVTRRSVYALDLRTGRPTAFDPGLRSSQVQSLALMGDLLLVGGQLFGGVAGPPQGLLALDAGTGRQRPWSPMSGSFSRASSLLVSGGRLFVGGSFTQFGDTLRSNLAVLDLSTGALLPSLTPDGPVTALSSFGQGVLLGGEFLALSATYLPGPERSRGAALFGPALELLPWNPMANGGIASLGVGGSRVVVGGSFDTLQGQPAPGVGVFDAATGVLLPYQPPPSVLGSFASAQFPGFPPECLAGRVCAVAVGGNQIFVGGNGLGAMSATTGADLGWRPTLTFGAFDGVASSLTRYPDVLVAAGVFTSAGGRPVLNLAIFPSAGASAPIHLRARANATTVSLAWDPPVDAVPDGYDLDVTKDGAYLGAFPHSSTSFSTSVPPGTYAVRVRARVGGVPGDLCPAVTFTMPSPAVPPAAPSALTGAVVNGVVRLAWTSGAGGGNVESFVIEAGSAPGLTNLASFDTGFVDDRFTSPAPSGTYYVRVRAKNASGVGGASNEVTVVVP